MDSEISGRQKTYIVILSLLGWFALISQFYININSKISSIPETMIRYFSYFTINSNLIVTVCATIILLKPNVKLTRFLSRQSSQTAIAVYLFIVGLIYNVILRFIWNPEGLQMIVDELLHLVIPVLFITYWILFSNKNQLNRKIILPWLTYPFIYIIFVLTRGSWSGFYPYPFINVNELGLNAVLFNCVGIAVLFILVSLIFVAVGNYIVRKKLVSMEV